jgi:hypothetical protein
VALATHLHLAPRLKKQKSNILIPLCAFMAVYRASFTFTHEVHAAYYIPCVKDKSIPLQSWTGPEGSRTLRLPDFKTVGT